MYVRKIIWFTFIELYIAVIVLLILCPLYCIFAVTVYGISIGLSIVFFILTYLCGLGCDGDTHYSPCDCKVDDCKIACVIDMGKWIKTYYEREIHNFSCYHNDVEPTEVEFSGVVIHNILSLPSYSPIDDQPRHIDGEPLPTPPPPSYSPNSDIEDEPPRYVLVTRFNNTDLGLDSES